VPRTTAPITAHSRRTPVDPTDDEHKLERVPLFSAGGQFAGIVRRINGRAIMLRFVDPARHMLRRPPAWAMDVCVRDEAERLGVREVFLKEEGGRRIWRARLRDFRRHGIPINRQAGPQIALPLARWQLETAR